ncbi:hypothetical protein OTK51_13395 [Vibrio scophthalmi]|uniref:hypothetical protein n=1 Tax=Vibrio scophthalmi TaxID=45658 RepID=UPI002284A86C|nr:hypothetical protein [Vibrio scophthalmi]MCY9804423.1 hypothetical protein [Vibrio scophthalmi]
MKSIFYNGGIIETEKEAKIESILSIEEDGRLNEDLIKLGFESESDICSNVLMQNEEVYDLYCNYYETAINKQLALNDLIVDYDNNLRDAIYIIRCGWSIRNREDGINKCYISQSMNLTSFSDFPTLSTPLSRVPVRSFTDILEYFKIDYSIRTVNDEDVYVIFKDLDNKQTTLVF